MNILMWKQKILWSSTPHKELQVTIWLLEEWELISPRDESPHWLSNEEGSALPETHKQ